MQIIWDSEVAIGGQMRAYAEYCLFFQVGRFHPRLNRTCICLRRRRGTPERFVCTIAVDDPRRGDVRVRARGDCVRGAIDKAAGRLRRRLAREPLEARP
jgi:hypothetical protein